MKVWQRIKKLLDTALFDHAAWMVGGSGLQAAVGFGGNLVLVWFLTPEEFGRFAVIQANIGLVSAVVNFKIGEAVLKASNEELHERWSAYANVQLLQSVTIVSAATAILWVQSLLTLEAGILLTGGFIAPWVSLFVKNYERDFEYRNISILESGAHIGCHAIAVVGALLGMGGIVLYVREFTRSVGKMIGVWYLNAIRSFDLRLPRVSDWKFVFSQVRGFWVDGILESSYERLLIIAVEALAGQRITGYFFQAKRLAIVPHQLLQPLTSRIAYNYFSHRVSVKAGVRKLLQTLAAEFALLVFAAVGVLYFADPIIPFVFGSTWSGVVPLLQAMVGVVACLTLFNTLKFYCMANGLMRSFVGFGRGWQFAGLGIAVTTVLLDWNSDGGVVLSIGYSAGYVIGLIAALTAIVARRTPLPRVDTA